jgi:hypothetical protein
LQVWPEWSAVVIHLFHLKTSILSSLIDIGLG